MRDLISNSLEEGGKTGVAGMMKHWLAGVAEMGRKAAFTRISTLLANRLMGSNLETDEDGPLSRKRKNEDQGTEAEAPAPEKAPSLASRLTKTPFRLSPDIDVTPFSPLKKRGVLDSILGGKGGKQNEMQSATFYIETATQNVKSATIYTTSSTTKSPAGGAGTSPSSDQKISTALDFLSRSV